MAVEIWRLAMYPAAPSPVSTSSIDRMSLGSLSCSLLCMVDVRLSVGRRLHYTVLTAETADTLVRLDCRLVGPPQFNQARLQGHPFSHQRNLLQTILKRASSLVRQIAGHDQRRSAHAFHAVDQHRTPCEELVQLPNRLLQPADIVAVAVDELDAPPGEAMAVGGAVRPAVQRQDALDSRASQSGKP